MRSGTLEDFLLAYSEWLDAACGLIKATGEDSPDDRTHEELVRDFLVWLEEE